MLPLRHCFDIIIPVYNEIYISKLFKLFQRNIRNKFQVLLVYDSVEDRTLTSFNPNSYDFQIKCIKNHSTGPHEAIMTGIASCESEAIIFYPADDFLNTHLLDVMYEKYIEGNDVVVPSRFIKGGTMKNCPILKSLIVRLASTSLFYLSNISVRDATNGFRLFSYSFLKSVIIESNKGFTFSIELLVKATRLQLQIAELPSQWEERTYGKSRFQLSRWLFNYLTWYLYALATFWLRKAPLTVKMYTNKLNCK